MVHEKEGAKELSGSTHGARGVSAVLIAPSVLSCDLLRLADQVRAVEQAGADLLHVDIMDGHFVPALTFGPKFVETLARLTRLPLDVHLMVTEPERWAPEFVKAGAGLVSFHAEACLHPRRLLGQIRSLGAKAGLALNPATPPAILRYLATEVDLVVAMSVDPGFAAQSFIPQTLPKLGEIRGFLEAGGAAPGEDPPSPPAGRPGGGQVVLEVDGGVGPANAGALAAAGATVLVAGNSVFGRPDPAQALADLRRSLTRCG